VRATLGARGEALAAALDQLDRARYGRDGRGAVDRRWWARFRAEAAALKPASASAA
jgi:hypothetical protein